MSTVKSILLSESKAGAAIRQPLGRLKPGQLRPGPVSSASTLITRAQVAGVASENVSLHENHGRAC